MTFYKKWSFWLFLTAMLFVTLFSFKKIFNSVEVRLMPVKLQELTITVTATSTGTIKSDKEVRVTAQRIGRVSKLYVEEGSVVSPGSVIAELDPDEAYLNLQIAQASLEKSQSMLDQLRASFNSSKVEIETNIDKTKAIFKEAEAKLTRFGDLKEKGYISQLDFDSVQREYDVARAGFESAVAAIDRINAQTEEIKAQEAAVKEAKNSEAIARLNYDYSFVKSSLSGVITSRPVELGETVSKGSLIANIVSTKELYIEAFIDEADVAKVKLGQDVNITMDAYQGQNFKGEVYMISPVVLGGKQETRTFEVRTRFRGKELVVKPGMSADIEIIVDSVKNTLVVPSQAVIERNGKKNIFIKEGSYAKLVSVETGRFNWSFTEIVSGIKEGDTVITNPDAAGLEDGKRVKEKKE